LTRVPFQVPVVLALWVIYPSKASHAASNDKTPPELTISLALFGFLALSRLGVWVFDLTTQQLTQTLVPARERSTFAGIESSVNNVFDLLGSASAIAFPRTEQFHWLALASWVVVAFAWLMYAVWVGTGKAYSRRG